MWKFKNFPTTRFFVKSILENVAFLFFDFVRNLPNKNVEILKSLNDSFSCSRLIKINFTKNPINGKFLHFPHCDWVRLLTESSAPKRSVVTGSAVLFCFSFSSSGLNKSIEVWVWIISRTWNAICRSGWIIFKVASDNVHTHYTYVVHSVKNKKK